MSGIIDAMLDPVLFGFAIGINFLVGYMKPIVRFMMKIKRKAFRIVFKVEPAIKDRWGFRTLSLILSVIVVSNADRQWISMDLVGESKLATVFYLWMVSWIIYDVGVKLVMQWIKDRFIKEMKPEDDE
ncbi:MAG: hypothetical protein SVK08_00330 [Halobacteriota archaeon]|nr:hypothetical protein [Halobacteriota archaeon]